MPSISIILCSMAAQSLYTEMLIFQGGDEYSLRMTTSFNVYYGLDRLHHRWVLCVCVCVFKAVVKVYMRESLSCMGAHIGLPLLFASNVSRQTLLCVTIQNGFGLFLFRLKGIFSPCWTSALFGFIMLISAASRQCQVYSRIKDLLYIGPIYVTP